MASLKEVHVREEDERVQLVMDQLPERRNTVSQTLFILAKSFIASGVLFLPNAFMRGGLLFSPVFIFFVNIVCIYSFLKLFKVFMKLRVNFGDMATLLYGNWLRYAIYTCVIFSQLGFCCSYFSFLQQNLGEIVRDRTTTDLSVLEWILILLAAWIPFVMIRKLTMFAYTSLIADGCIVVGLMYLFVYCGDSLAHKGPETTLRLVNWESIGVCIGTAIFAFEGVNMVVPIAESMEKPEKFPICLTGIMTGVATIYAAMGTLGYATFGDNVAEIITLNIPKGIGQLLLIILYSFAVFFTLPLMFFPAMQIIEPGIWKRPIFSTWSSKKIFWGQNIIRFLVLCIVGAISYIARSNLTNFISIVGSCTGGPLCFIFPPLLHIRAISKTKTEKMLDLILMVFGFAVFVFTLYESIITWED